MRGRPPKPAELRRLEGGSTVSHRPVVEPLLVAGRPDLQTFAEPPPGLAPDAHSFWRETVKLLAEVGILDSVDKPALIELATAHARILQCRRVTEGIGLFALGAAGQNKEAPWVRAEREWMLVFDRLSEKFALNPVARMRLGLAELSRRAMAHEMEQALDGDDRGEPVPVPDAEVVADADVGLPGI